MHELALFAGIGGGILGGHLLGWRTVCAVEKESYCREVLLRRQRDGVLPLFPIWDDINTFDGRPWRGKVDVISGGFPCQDISCAGKGEGIDGPRSGLWWEMARIVDEVQPKFAFVENTTKLANKGLDRIINWFESKGYGGKAGIFPSLHEQGYHIRNRIFILADSSRIGWKWIGVSWPSPEVMESNRLGEALFLHRANEAGIAGVGYGIPHRVDRIKATGNGQVPIVAATAWKILNRATLEDLDNDQ